MGLSQRELALLTEIPERTIREYEKNRYRSASLEKLIKIAQALENYRKEKIEKLNDLSKRNNSAR